MSRIFQLFSGLDGIQSNTAMACWIGKSTSGEQITPETALGISSYYACIKVISEDLAKLPINVYKKEDKQRVNIDGHIVDDFLNFEVNPTMGASVFRMTVTSHALGWGGGFAEIQRSFDGTPVALWLIHPSRVAPELKGESLKWNVLNDDGTKSVIDDVDIFHIHTFGHDGVQGYTPADIGRESLGIALAEIKFGGMFYGNGTNLGGVLEHPAKLSDPAYKRLREHWNTRYKGNEKSHETAILEEDMKYKPLGVNPKDAQFIEGRQFSVEEICRWFRVAPHKIQHLLRATFSNIEHSNIDHVIDTLLPWVVIWETEIRRKLFNRTTEKKHRAKVKLQGLLRGDNASRASYYNTMYHIGAMNPNEIREFEDMNPRDKGEEFMSQANMISDRQRTIENNNPQQTKQLPQEQINEE